MDFLEIAKFFGIIVFAYMLGAVPWGLIFTKMYASRDIRHNGSGNIGASNVRRVVGPKVGILVLACDLLKGAVPVWFAGKVISPDHLLPELCMALAGFAAFSGHLYPVYLKFKTGGKGVATAAGCFVVIAPKACMIAVVVFILIVFISNYVSAGSITAAIVLPFTVWWETHSYLLVMSASVMTILIFVRHSDNIKRILSGTESVFRNKHQ